MLTASLLRRSPSLLPSARSVTKTCSTELNVLKATPSSCRIVLLPNSLYHAATSSIDWVLVCHQTQAEAWKPERKERGQRSGHAWSSCPCQTHNTSTPLDASTEAMVRDPGQFYSLAQFAVFTSKLAPARGEPAPTVFGWSGQMLVPDTRPGRRL